MTSQLEFDIPVRSVIVQHDGPFGGRLTTSEYIRVQKLLHPWKTRNGREAKPVMRSDGMLYTFHFKHDPVTYMINGPMDLLRMAVNVVALCSEDRFYYVCKDGSDLHARTGDHGTSNMIWRAQRLRDEFRNTSNNTDKDTIENAIMSLCLLAVWLRSGYGCEYEVFEVQEAAKPNFENDLDRISCFEDD